MSILVENLTEEVIVQDLQIDQRDALLAALKAFLAEHQQVVRPATSQRLALSTIALAEGKEGV